MKKVSFIVPVYNVENYIERCIKSIMKQTYDNWELIIVDDGSTDKSGEIVDRLKKSDNRISVIHKINEGVSIARNSGLERAKGDYVLFVDGDDYVDSHYASYFVNIMVNNNADIVFSYNYYNEYSTDCITTDKIHHLSPLQAMESLYLNKTGVAVWNKIYSKEFLHKNHLQFNPEFWFAEGMTFNIEAFQCAKTIIAGEACLYHQVYNSESAVRKFNINSWYCGLRAMDFQRNIWKIQNIKLTNAWEYHKKEYNFGILKGIYQSQQENKYITEVKKCIKNLRAGIKYSLIVDIPIKAKIKSLIVAIFPKYMIKRAIKKEMKVVTKE